MKERGILFSGPMVLAILEGRKNQTRRLVKPQPPLKWDRCGQINGSNGAGVIAWDFYNSKDPLDHGYLKKLYAQPGQRLWVREAWRRPHNNPDTPLKAGQAVQYRASLPWHDGFGGPWKQSIHMPRWASRLTLEVTGVRVERLQDISTEDAIAEGIEANDDDGVTYYGPLNKGHADPRAAYQLLWESINGAGSWGLNPFVWVISFRRTGL